MNIRQKLSQFAAYNRNKVCAEFGEKLDQLQKADPFGYIHSTKIHEAMEAATAVRRVARTLICSFRG